jgi:N utilization substance protein B
MDVVGDALGELAPDKAPAEAADALYDLALFQELLRGVPEHLAELDGRLDSVLDRPITQVTPVDLAILRMSVYELLSSPNIPFRVILNEAVELAKEFGSTDDSHRYVNGVLDKIARDLRAAEVTADPALSPSDS